MWWKRYERILDQKPVTTREALIDLLAKEQCEMLEAFPPDESQIEWSDEKLAAKFRGRMHEMPAPDPAQVDLLCTVLAHDLQHETDRIDWIFRNDKHRDVCPTQDSVEVLHLLWRTCLEVLYTRKDELSAHLKTADLVRVVEKTAKLFRARRAAVQ
jgi:hypothetical protein